MGIGNLGVWEIMVIAIIVLVFFGPRRLPEIARSSGKAIREFKRGLNEIQRELELAETEESRGEARASTRTAEPEAAPGTDPPAPDDHPPAPDGHPPAPADAASEGGPGTGAVEARRPERPAAEKATVPDPDQEELFGP